MTQSSAQSMRVARSRADTEPGDAHLLQQIGRGDAEAFRVLVDRHGVMPYRIAVRMLNHRGDAEDIAQEALLRLWRLADRAAEIRSVPGWLQTVATNLCLDRLRQQQRQTASADGLEDLVDGAPRADAVIEQAQVAGAAQRAIARLPDQQRAAIILTYYEELPNAAACEVLGMGIKAFESLLGRARGALRRELARNGAGPAAPELTGGDDGRV